MTLHRYNIVLLLDLTWFLNNIAVPIKGEKENGMKNMKFASVLLAGVTAMSLVGCGSSSEEPKETAASTAAAEKGDAAVSGTVTASGSSALLPLAQDAAEKFNEKNPDCIITVNGGGSGTGLKQVSDGSVDIGNSDVFAEEKLEADAAKELVDHKVATITVAPVVNKNLGVDNLTSEQLIGIFTGEIKNWKEVDGPDMDIVLVTRPSSSGTRALFSEYALDGREEASNAALETDDSGTLAQTIADNEGAIGYLALSYLTNNDSVAPVSIDGVEPTLENTYNGTYNVWGYEHMYTKGEAEGAAKAFIDYISGDEYASHMEDMGYGVASKLSDKAVASHE